jgi:hypothetical protein
MNDLVVCMSVVLLSTGEPRTTPRLKQRHTDLARSVFLMRVRLHARLIEEGVAGRNVPLRRVAQDAGRPEPGRRHPPFIGIEKEELARDCWGGVVLQHLRLSTLIACPLRFKCHSDPKTRIEIRAVLEVDGNLGTVAAFFKECDRPDDFSGKVLAFNHGQLLSA